MLFPNEHSFVLQAVAQDCCHPQRRPRARLSGDAAYTIVLVRQGSGLLRTEAATFRLEAGAVWLRLPGETAELSSPSPAGLCWAAADFQVFPSAAGTGRPTRDWGRQCALRTPAPHERAAALARSLLALPQRRPEPAPPDENAPFAQWLRRLLANGDAGNAVHGGGTPAGDAIDRVLLHMKRAFGGELPHRELARLAGMTASHFSYAFRKRTGRRPMDYLSDIRIGESKRLLFPAGLSVKETARSVGFADEYYFSRRFKQQVGVSPAAYVRIRKSPMRTVALTYTGQLLAVGVKPLGAPREHLANCRFDPLKTGIADIGDYARIDPESIARLRPDLILAAEETPGLESCEAVLKRIAPVAVIPWDKDDVFGHLRHIAGLLDKEQEAEAWIRAHLERAGHARETILPFVGPRETASFLRISHNYIGLWSGKAFGHVLYHSLGFAAPDAVAALMDERKSFRPLRLRMEELARYAGDMLFVSVTEDAASQDYYRSLSGEPAWRALPAVANGRLFQVSDTKWKFYEPRAITAQLQDAVRLLVPRRSS